jgi:hypothetical protein
LQEIVQESSRVRGELLTVGVAQLQIEDLKHQRLCFIRSPKPTRHCSPS